MGLDTTHNCWHGSYSSFHHWRVKVASACGINLDEMDNFGGHLLWSSLKPDIIHVLLDHSDSEGYISAKDCAPLADRLEKILPLISPDDEFGSWHTRTVKFIRGLRLAARRGEQVSFH